ncbi:glycosyltransferase family 2 protein [Rhizobium paknamense]|uniref:Glycosyltransferase involved in cell wall biosynthesis n=1 Tax=Rhizobium paknamense TaxID=1206817 RepID=A0ABU0IF24_9HYPH|nr:glycosyltransferase [Rhizobium paknamense]MDQ0456065.1 glycosyltransferase involved in cell wall biosynthesis [Rhizobium paknamense]
MKKEDKLDTILAEIQRSRAEINALNAEIAVMQSNINLLTSRHRKNLFYKIARPLITCIDRVRFGSAPKFFDENWYVSTYPDVANAGINPWVHFRKYGEQEGRDPNPLFSTVYYLEAYADVKQKGMSPLAHYMKFGAKEGRNPHSFFDSGWYLDTYPDVKKQGMNPLLHFLRHGIQEGRMPNSMFDSEWYLKLRPDVQAANMSAIYHYVYYGIKEGQPWRPNPGARTDTFVSFNAGKNSYSLSLDRMPYTYIPLRPRPSALEFIQRNSAQIKFSIIVPVYNTPIGLLDKAYESVKSQWYPNWELIFVDDHSTEARVPSDLARISRGDSRVKLVETPSNQGIAGATNVGISAARGDYIVFLDHDDELTSDCLYELAKRIHETTADFIYSDEDKIDEHGNFVQPFFKPDWSPDTLMSTMYTCHVSCVKRSLALSAGPLDPSLDGAQDWDFILKVSEKASRIEHIAKVLYHWRIIPNSIAADLNAKPKAVEHGRLARSNALKRRNHSGSMVHVDALPSHYTPVYLPKPGTLVSIIIPTKNNFPYLSECISSILSNTLYKNFEIVVINNGSSEERTINYLDEINRNSAITVLTRDAPFNFSELCNYGASKAAGDVYVFLNDDTEILEGDWLGAITGHAQLAHAGAVGAKLIYGEENSIQHNGILNLQPGPCHAFARQTPDFPGYFGRSVLPYNWIAVTGALMAIEKHKFWSVGGFDEGFPVAYNDIDLCFRLKKAGWHNVNLPIVQVIHHESVSRGIDHENSEKFERLKQERHNLYCKHPDLFQHDPYYNVNMHPLDVQFDLATKWRPF